MSICTTNNLVQVSEKITQKNRLGYMDAYVLYFVFSDRNILNKNFLIFPTHRNGVVHISTPF